MGVKLSPTPPAFNFGEVLIGTQSDPTTVTIKNEGTDLSMVPGIVVAAPFKIITNGCTSGLAANQTCQVQVVFTPDAPGPKAGSLDVTNGGSGTKLSTALTGNGVKPASLTINPASKDFGGVTVGSDSADVTFVVKNEGGREAAKPTLGVTGDFAIKMNGCTAALPTNAMCNVVIVFSPTTPTTKSGTLTASVPATSISATANLTGHGVAVGQPIFQPSTADFGSVVVTKMSAPQTLKIVNSGGPLAGVSVSAANTSDFKVDATKCVTMIAAGASCDVTVTFTPTAPGLRMATLILNYTGGSASAALSGTGQAAARLVAVPSPIDFGSVANGAKSAPVVVTVRNAADEGAAGVSAVLSGPGMDQFSVASSCDVVLAGNAMCTLAVTFAPNKVSDATASLLVSGTPGGMSTVSLSGKGVVQGALDIDPKTKDFLAVNVGSTSGGFTFTVNNTGDVETGAVKIDKLGTDAGDFVIDTDSCTTFKIAPKSACSVVAHFAPGTAGVKNATLNATASPGGTTSSILTGVGVPGTKLVITGTGDFGRVPVGKKSQTQTFTVTNNGGAGSGPVSVQPGSSLFHKSADTCATKAGLAPLETCTFDLDFEPAVEGDAKSTVVATASPGGSSNELQLTGVGVKPSSIVFTNGSEVELFLVDFGRRGPNAQTVGTQSASKTVFVRNIGSSATGMLSTALNGVNKGDFVITANTCAASLEPGSQCSMDLAVKPTVAGNLEAAVDVTAMAGGTASLALRGVGLALLEIVEDFGEGGESDEPVTVSDFGQWSAGRIDGPTKRFIVRARTNASTVQSVLAGETPKNFVKGDIAAEHNLPGSPVDNCNNVVLNGTASFDGSNPGMCKVTIKFVPQHEGMLTAPWTVTSSAGQTAAVTLTGTGTGALSITPAPLNFGTVAIGSTKEQIFTVTNNGPNVMTSVNLVLSSSADFAVVKDTCPAAVMDDNDMDGGLPAGFQPDETCDITIRFIPAETGMKSVTLTGTGTFLVGGAVTTATTTVAITGNSIAGPAITVNPPAPAFQAAAVGATGDTVTFTVANAPGSPPTGKIKVSTSPSQSNAEKEFVLLRNGCVALNQQLDEPGLPLDTGKSCTFDIRFQPRNTGTRVATLIVQAVEGPGGTVSIPLSAVGTPTLTLAPAVVDLNSGPNVNLIGSPTNKTYDVVITNHAAYSVGVTVALLNAVGVLPGARPGDEAAFAINNACTTIAAGASCTFNVRMQSSDGEDVGLHKALAKVTGTAPGGSPGSNSPSAQLTGRLTPDAKVVANTDGSFLADFGTVRVGDTSAKKILVVTNVGGVSSGPISGSVVDTGEIVIGGNCVGNAGLAPQASCNFELQLAPTSEGLLDDAFTVKVTGRGATTIPNDLAGNKVATTSPYITPTPDFFGTITAGAAAGVTHTFTLFNPSNSARTVNLQSVTTDGSWTFAGSGGTPCTVGSADAGPNAMAANGSCTFTATFKPTTGSGVSAAKVEFCLGDVTDCPINATSTYAQLHGLIGAIPTLEIEESVDGGDFGDVISATGSVSPARIFTVRNIGNDTSAIVDVSLQDRPETVGDFGGTVDDSSGTGTLTTNSFGIDASGCAKTLAPKGQPGDSCTVSVVAKPTTTGGRRASIVAKAAGATVPPTTASSAKLGNPLAIRTNGVFDTTIDIINTYGVTGGAALNTTAVNFGEVPVGAEVQRFVEIGVEANDLTASSLSYTLAADSTNFRVDSNPAASPMGTLPPVATCFSKINSGGLKAGEHCLVGVFFRPQSLPAASVPVPNMTTKLTILAQSGTSGSLTITGQAISALRLEASLGTKATAPVAFATTGAGKVSAPVSVWARNQIVASATGAPPTTGQLSVKIDGANAADFRMVADACIGITIDADATCKIDMQFEPATTGAKTATLTVSGNPGNSASVGLSGTAN